MKMIKNRTRSQSTAKHPFSYAVKDYTHWFMLCSYMLFSQSNDVKISNFHSERKKKKIKIKKMCNFHSSLKSPGMLPADLLFFLRGEIIIDVKLLANLLRSHVLDHVSNSLTSKIQKAPYVEVICSKDKIKECALVDFYEVSVKSFEVLVGGNVAVRRLGSLDMALAVLYDLGEDLARNVGERNNVVSAVVLDHMLDRLRLQSHRFLQLESLTVITLQDDHL